MISSLWKLKILGGGRQMPFKADCRSAEEIRKIGIDALVEALGPVDAVRFLQSFELGRGDYARERSHVLGLTLDEIFMGIEIIKKRVNRIECFSGLQEYWFRFLSSA